MAVAELPLPPFPYEKDFFGSPFPKGGKRHPHSDHVSPAERGRQSPAQFQERSASKNLAGRSFFMPSAKIRAKLKNLLEN